MEEESLQKESLEKAKDIGEEVVSTALPVMGSFCGNYLLPGIGGEIGNALTQFILNTLTVKGNRAIERRLNALEQKIEDEITFKNNMNEMQEHDMYAWKEIFQKYLISVPPEVADASLDLIIAFVMEKRKRSIWEDAAFSILNLSANDIKELQWMRNLIKKEYNGNYKSILKWNKIARIRGKNTNGEEIGVPLSMLAINEFVKTTNDEKEVSFEATHIYRSYKALSENGIIYSHHQDVVGMNGEFMIDEIQLTVLGQIIMEKLPN